VNILEHIVEGDEGKVAWTQQAEDVTVELDFRAFEIKTLKLTLV